MGIFLHTTSLLLAYLLIADSLYASSASDPGRVNEEERKHQDHGSCQVVCSYSPTANFSLIKVIDRGVRHFLSTFTKDQRSSIVNFLDGNISQEAGFGLNVSFYHSLNAEKVEVAVLGPNERDLNKFISAIKSAKDPYDNKTFATVIQKRIENAAKEQKLKFLILSKIERSQNS